MNLTPMPDLSGLSIAQLGELEGKIQDEIKHRSDIKKKEVLSKIKALAAEGGYSLEELISQKSAGGKSAATARVVAPKYRHPQDAGITWTGRGKKPRWVAETLAAGGALEDLLISR